MARRSYDASLRVGLATAPIHPITAAAYYSLGCVEFEKKNFDNARQVTRFRESMQQLIDKQRLF
jgi:hypothetical protein